MCTIALAWQVFESTALVIGANRDERYDRPSGPPERQGETPAVLAPVDRKAGGTWIGVNDAGLVVALTNRWGGPIDEGHRSRGLLVAELLSHGDAQQACRALERELDDTPYDGFYLLCADTDDAMLVEYDGGPLLRTLTPGVHVVMNAGVDTQYRIPSERAGPAREQAANGRALYTALQPEPGELPAHWRERTMSALGDHDRGVCIHGDGFGTRSSSVIALEGDSTSEYWFADGPPCETAYERVSPGFD